MKKLKECGISDAVRECCFNDEKVCNPSIVICDIDIDSLFIRESSQKNVGDSSVAFEKR